MLRWKDVALAIVSFVESRRKGQGSVILVAHNGKRFDVPFIMKEFRDCDVPIPSYWRFADSMPLARSAMKSLGKYRFYVDRLCVAYTTFQKSGVFDQKALKYVAPLQNRK